MHFALVPINQWSGGTELAIITLSLATDLESSSLIDGEGAKVQLVLVLAGLGFIIEFI